MIPAAASRVSIRFAATLIANVARSGVSFLTSLLVAKYLGPASYGELAFLLASFLAINQLLDVGSSSAFYTFVSRGPRPRRFFAMFLTWLLVQFVGVALVIALMPADMLHKIWVGQARSIVLLALCANFAVTQLWGIVNQLGESARLTVLTQGTAAAQALLHLLLVAAAAWWNVLSISTVMTLLILENAVFAALIGPIVLRRNVQTDAPAAPVRETFAEYKAYCAPLLVFSGAGFIYNFSDRWLLQWYGGSQEQGYFAIGQQFAAVSLLATGSILRVFWKELAEASGRGDAGRVKQLSEQVQRSMFFVTAWVSCLFIPYSREILVWSVGPGYAAAWLGLAIMLLYPVHQSMGQIVGTFFYATGHTRPYVQTGLITMLVSLPIGYLILAPRDAAVPGLALGAEGLAAKMVVIQIFSVTALSMVATRRGGPAPGLGHQFATLTGALALGLACRQAGRFVSSYVPYDHTIVTMGAGLVLYCLISLLVFLRWPELGGLARTRLQRRLADARRFVLGARLLPDSTR